MSDSPSFSGFNPISYSDNTNNVGFNPSSFALDDISNSHEDQRKEGMLLGHDDGVDTPSDKLNKKPSVFHLDVNSQIDLEGIISTIKFNPNLFDFQNTLPPPISHDLFLKCASELGVPKKYLKIGFGKEDEKITTINDPLEVQSKFPSKIKFALQSNTWPLGQSALTSDNYDNQVGNSSQELSRIFKKIIELSLCKETYEVETIERNSGNSVMSIIAQMSQELFDLINKYLELEKKSSPKDPRKVKFERKSKENQKVTYDSSKYKQKNFPKKIGDRLCDHIDEIFGIKAHDKLKDRTSWKLLNSFLSGSSKIAKNIDHKTFTRCFLEFMANYNIDYVNKTSKTTVKISKICDSINAMTLSLCCKEILKKIQSRESYGHIVIIRSWPKAVVEIHQ